MSTTGRAFEVQCASINSLSYRAKCAGVCKQTIAKGVSWLRCVWLPAFSRAFPARFFLVTGCRAQRPAAMRRSARGPRLPRQRVHALPSNLLRGAPQHGAKEPVTFRHAASLAQTSVNIFAFQIRTRTGGEQRRPHSPDCFAHVVFLSLSLSLSLSLDELTFVHQPHDAKIPICYHFSCLRPTHVAAAIEAFGSLDKIPGVAQLGCVDKLTRAAANAEASEAARAKKKIAEESKKAQAKIDKAAARAGAAAKLKAEKAASKEKEKAEKAAAKEKEKAEKAAAKEKEKAENAAAKEKEKAEKAAAKEKEKAEKAAAKEKEKAEKAAAREKKEAEKAAARGNENAIPARATEQATKREPGLTPAKRSGSALVSNPGFKKASRKNSVEAEKTFVAAEKRFTSNPRR